MENYTLFSLHQPMTDHTQFQPFPDLNEQVDELTWRFNSNGQYSTASIYKMLISGGLIKWEFKAIWKYSIPPTVKVFRYLLLKERLLTREVMIYRNFNCTDTVCSLCDTGVLESAIHLFFECPFAKAIWNSLSCFLGDEFLGRGRTVLEIWRRSSANLKHKPAIRTRGECFLSAGCWMIWRQRNNMIFEQREVVHDVVTQWIVSEATLWETNCKMT